MTRPKFFPVSGAVSSFCGYVIIIALLCMFPKNGRVDLAIRLTNSILPLFFFALGGAVFNLFDWIMVMIFDIMKTRRVPNE